jgi:Predicted esterase
MTQSLHDARSGLRLGAPLASARAAVILLHGRGSSARDMAGLAMALNRETVSFVLPEATNNTWYPQRFLVPAEANEPWLSSALDVIETCVNELLAAGVPSERIGIAGFSQGACLSLEYALTHPRRYGFVGGLSGALIGPLERARPAANLQGTPVLVACAELDAHIPLGHVEQSVKVFRASGAEVTRQVYAGSAHTIFPEELSWLKTRVAALA